MMSSFFRAPFTALCHQARSASGRALDTVRALKSPLAVPPRGADLLRHRLRFVRGSRCKFTTHPFAPSRGKAQRHTARPMPRELPVTTAVLSLSWHGPPPPLRGAAARRSAAGSITNRGRGDNPHAGRNISHPAVAKDDFRDVGLPSLATAAGATDRERYLRCSDHWRRSGPAARSAYFPGGPIPTSRAAWVVIEREIRPIASPPRPLVAELHPACSSPPPTNIHLSAFGIRVSCAMAGRRLAVGWRGRAEVGYIERPYLFLASEEGRSVLEANHRVQNRPRPPPSCCWSRPAVEGAVSPGLSTDGIVRGAPRNQG